MKIARVIVDVPSRATDRPFDYEVPAHLAERAQIGSRASVTFGGRKLQGFIVGFADHAEVDVHRLKPISHIMDEIPPLTPELIALGSWISRRWVCPLVVSLQAMLPAALKGKSDRPTIRTVTMVYPPHPDEAGRRIMALPANARKQREALAYLQAHPEPAALADVARRAGVNPQVIRALAQRGCVEIRQVEQDRDPYAGRDFPLTRPMTLTKGQQEALAPIVAALSSREHRAFLLHGVTGSGKTEIYLQAIQQCLAQGREAIVLVPEIALTPQMVERFKSRFGARVAVLHSRLSQGERYDEWRKIREGRAQVAVGARSAVFAPFARIGLIVIDEEHETSYKQEESPKYHARDVAMERARMNRAVVVLGSATPSLESFAAASSSRSAPADGVASIGYLALPERVGDRPMPAVHIVDMREELRMGNRAMFSNGLRAALEKRLERGEQTVLLLNRRGYSTFVMCRSCGYTCLCPHCDIALTHHRGVRHLRCHYCGHAEPEPTVCPSCQSPHIRFFGTGTQKVEEALGTTFPGIRVIRMDVDTTTEKGAHEKWLTLFRERKADVLLGTQMVAKGLDFPHVTLVGVLAADAALRLPDFRAAERTFQLLTQVAGRAGRHQLPGEVFIQTYDPAHPAVAAVANHDYDGFVRQELHARRMLGYPPFGRLVIVTFTHESTPLLIAAGELFVNRMKEIAAAKGIAALDASGEKSGMDILGPVPSPIPRLKDRYRFQCMIKYRGEMDASEMVALALKHMGDATRRGVQIGVDVDPQMML